MIEKNNSKGLICLIILLIVLIIGLITYIIYDKIILDNKINETDNVTTQNKETTNIFDNILDNKIVFDKNKDYNFKYEIECLNKDENNFCLEESLKINNIPYSVSPTSEINIFEEYILIIDDGGTGFSGDFKLIDFAGKEIISKKYIGTICNNECNYFGIRGNNNKIYYIEYKNNSLYMNSIDLKDNYNIKEELELTNYNLAG